MQGCAFLALVDIAAHLGDQYIAQTTPIWGGVNRRFRAKCTKYWNVQKLRIQKSKMAAATIYKIKIKADRSLLRATR